MSSSKQDFLAVLLQNSARYGLADLLSKLAQFFAFPLLANTLQPKGFGILELCMTLVMLSGLIGNFGTNNSVQRFYWEAESDKAVKSSIVSTGFLILITGFVFVNSTLLIIVYVFELNFLFIEQYLSLCLFIILFAFGNQVIQFVLDWLRLRDEFMKFFVLSILSRMLVLIVVVFYVIETHVGATELVVVQSILTFACALFAVYLLSTELDLKSKFLTHAPYLFQYGYPFIFAGGAYWIFTATDRWMISYFLDEENVGVYSVGFRISAIILFFSTAFGQAWSPLAVKIRTYNPDIYKIIYADVYYFILAFMFLGGFTLLALYEWLINLFSLSQYYNSGNAAVWLVLANVISATFQVIAMGISLSNKTYLFAIIAWCCSLINILLNFILIPILGIEGAAIATVCTQFLMFLMYLEGSRRNYKIMFDCKRIYFIWMTIFLFFLAHRYIIESFDFGKFWIYEYVFYIIGISYVSTLCLRSTSSRLERRSIKFS